MSVHVKYRNLKNKKYFNLNSYNISLKKTTKQMTYKCRRYFGKRWKELESSHFNKNEELQNSS